MKLIISKTRIEKIDTMHITSGMVGATIDVEFSSDWEGLNKVAVFTNGEISKDIINPTDIITIPWEVLEKPNKTASVGFYGYSLVNGEKVLAIPTIYIDLGRIEKGADPSGDPSAEPTPTVVEQIQSEVNNHEERIAELEQGGGGSGGTTNYNALYNKPRINGVELSGNKTAAQLGINIPTKTSDLDNDSGFLTPPSLAPYRTAAAQDIIDNGKADASDVAAIEAKIPSAASSDNQLADKAFVNSTVGTNTAYYISKNGQPFNSLAELEAYSGTVTNNDYAFVVGTDSAGNVTYTRYKYNESTEAWGAEYVLNNSSFTAAQWAAITSGITSGDVAKIAQLETMMSGKLDKAQGVAHAGEFLVVGADGNVTTQSFETMTGGDY